MTKIYFKLITMAIALLLSVSVLIMSSYAWMILSSNPAATGIEVIIGGGNTILVAPNVADGNCNYPGHFSDSLNFGTLSEYDYLKNLGGLTPVSTSNGVDWFMPDYYSGNDEEVQSGKVMIGELKDVSKFKVDSELSHANLSADEKDAISEGHYVYLDFWVVSPGGDYILRVSTGDEDSSGGSFVADLPEAEKTEDGYTLSVKEKGASAAVRVGFLANDYIVTDDSMLKYQNSNYVDKRFTAFKGIYQEPNSGTAYLDSNVFTIYEPNANFHPSEEELDGSYVRTKPLALENGVITEVDDLWDHLTMQRSGNWVMARNGEQTNLEQQFQTALLSWEDITDLDEKEISEQFYKTYLQGYISSYYNKGKFVENSKNLAVYNEEVPKDSVEALFNAGATQNVEIIKLKQNNPQRIRMFIWLEGQDMDCIDGINSSRFTVNIEFAGGSE